MRLKTVLLVLIIVATAVAVALGPALFADVSRLEHRWPTTLPRDRTPPSWTRLDEIDEKLRWAVVAAEDSNFWTHEGIDWEATAEAFRHNIEKGGYRRGGSTITQQLAKNLFLSREKTILRKGREAILAWRLEHGLSKRRILELYLNIAEWGPDVYGAEQAARYHLGHSARSLTWGEAATLAAILPSPVNKLDPDRAPGRVRRRRAVVLAHLHRAGRLTRAEMLAAKDAPLTAAEARAEAAAEAREARENEPRPARPPLPPTRQETLPPPPVPLAVGRPAEVLTVGPVGPDPGREAEPSGAPAPPGRRLSIDDLPTLAASPAR